MRSTILWCIPVLMLALGTPRATGGGGPESTLLVVNSRSPLSLRLANFYRDARGIPDSHVLYLDQVPGEVYGGQGAMSIHEFRAFILGPIFQYLEDRNLDLEIDQVVYSSGFPTCIDFADVAQRLEMGPSITPTGSLTGLTFYGLHSMDDQAFDAVENRYHRGGVPQDGETTRKLNEWEAELKKQAREFHIAKDFKQALPLYRRLSGSVRDSGVLWYDIACCEAELGLSLHAIESLQRAVAAGWSKSFYATADGELLSLRHREEFQDLVALMRERSLKLHPSHGFRSRYAWGMDGKPEPTSLWEARQRPDGGYLLSTSLAWFGIGGNSYAEAVAALESAIGADGTHPDGTVYLLSNDDERSRARQYLFERTHELLRERGRNALSFSAETPDQDGVLPIGAKDVIGCVTGATDFYLATSGSRLVPGAICESLSGYGAAFWWNQETKLTEWIRHGAAGTSGTVAWPYFLVAKFPTPAVHVYYADGCSLAESFFQATAHPYQLLVLGDALCRPFAHFADVKIAAPGHAKTLQGKVDVVATMTPPESRAVKRVELWVDGSQAGEAELGAPISWDTGRWDDGAHELRVVAVEDSAIETRSTSAPVLVTVANHNHRVELSAPEEVRHGKDVALEVTAKGATQVEVVQGSRVVATLERQGEVWKAEASSQRLGLGRNRLVARAVFDDGLRALSAPAQVSVVEAVPRTPAKEPGYWLPGIAGTATDAEAERQFALTSLDPWAAIPLAELAGGESLAVEFSGQVLARDPGFYELATFTELAQEIAIGGQPLLQTPGGEASTRAAGVSLKKGWHDVSLKVAVEGESFRLQAFLSGGSPGHFLAGDTLRIAVPRMESVDKQPKLELRGAFPAPILTDGIRDGESQLASGGEVTATWSRALRAVTGMAVFLGLAAEAPSEDAEPFPTDWFVERKSSSGGWQKISSQSVRIAWDPHRGSIRDQVPAWIFVSFPPTTARSLRIRSESPVPGGVLQISEVEVVQRSNRP